MINPSKLESEEFDKIFKQLETTYIEELENMMISNLMEKKSIEIPGTNHETIEFAGRTNFKIRLKRPNKNIWSVSVQTLKESIRRVLREGILLPICSKIKEDTSKVKEFDLPVLMLLHTIPEQEYQTRSFVGNIVAHPTLGEGKILRITESGNVEIQFKDRKVKLKPNYVQLKKS